MARRAGLTSDRVVDAAVALADADGLDRLTLVRLAHKLGVRPPSLYEHVDGWRGLEKRIRQRGLEQLAVSLRRAATGRSGDDAVRGMAVAFRTFVQDHPALYEATVRSVEHDAPEVRAAAAEVLEILFAVLRGYGIAGEEAVHASRYLRSVLHGFTSLEAARGFGMPADLEASYQRLVDALVVTLQAWGRRKA